MIHEAKLSAVLSEFARTMATDFPIQGILDHLVERIVEILPVTAAGVTLITARKAPHYIAASDSSALRYEQLQTEVKEGPCLAAYETGVAIAVPDLLADPLFPKFSPAAVAAGLAAVFTFPLRHDGGRLGALDLYRDTPGPLDDHDLAAAQTLADVAAAYLLNAQARDEARITLDRFHHSALHDPLTGLPNRLLLEERLEHAIQRARRSHANLAIVFTDLDRFKNVNDTHGHRVGDALLFAVAQRLACLVRSSDTLARVSGDEFVFLWEDLHHQDDVHLLARRIDEAFIEPFLLNDLVLSITASVGIAFAGHGEHVSDQLMVDADTAMYQVKRKGGADHQVFDLREALQTKERNSLESDLRKATAAGKLDVAYQPVVRNSDGLVTGVEALLRWNHPDRGPVPALTAIGIAQQSNLINDIGAWILERSCHDHHRWRQDHPNKPLDLAVNMSVKQLMSHDFCDTVEQILQLTHMDPTALILEMTEDIFIADTHRAMTVLADLKSLGIRLALDDFGTGYSTLSYLRHLPVHIVKIDRAFIADIDHSSTGHQTGQALAAAVNDLAHVLGLSVTAEGIETKYQADQVRAMGCESAQGYFYAKPMDAADISTSLGRTNQRLTPAG
ncbi:MAG: hypothetical protein QOJ19_4891 [Acidimicrobiia bacterium]|nr:hypothetical protein [Acidimicrobiia bacterium]